MRLMNPYLGLAAAWCLAAATPVLPADTIETWDAGSGDIDFYLMMDGMGQDAASQGVAGDMLLGWGVAGRREFCLGPTVELNLDAAPERTAWGFYARTGLAVSGRGESAPEATAKVDG